MAYWCGVAGSEQKPPFYERHWFQGAVAAVGLVAAIWAFSGAPKPWDVAANQFTTKIARSNTEIILDASEGMDAPFGSGTKLDAATKAIGEYVVPLGREGLALRRAGGSCEESGELLVALGRHHNDDVAAAAAEQEPNGESNLAYTVIEAMEELNELEQPGPKQIIIITGTAEDECIQNAPEEIRRQLDRTGIEAVFKVVALKVSGSEREQLEDFTAALGKHAEVVFPENEEELAEAVEKAQNVNLEGLLGPSETTTTETSETTTTETEESPGTETEEIPPESTETPETAPPEEAPTEP